MSKFIKAVTKTVANLNPAKLGVELTTNESATAFLVGLPPASL